MDSWIYDFGGWSYWNYWNYYSGFGGWTYDWTYYAYGGWIYWNYWSPWNYYGSQVQVVASDESRMVAGGPESLSLSVEVLQLAEAALYGGEGMYIAARQRLYKDYLYNIEFGGHIDKGLKEIDWQRWNQGNFDATLRLILQKVTKKL